MLAIALNDFLIAADGQLTTRHLVIFIFFFFDITLGFPSAILASIFRQNAASSRSSTAFLQPVTNDPNGKQQQQQLNRRVSRTDLDFEQALRAEGTVILKEGIDVNTLGVVESPALNRSYSSVHHQSPTSTPVSRTISRVTLQPPTPTVVPPSPSPVTNASSSPMGKTLVYGRGASLNAAAASGGLASKAPVPSPSSSSQDLGGDLSPLTTTTTATASEEAATERMQTNRRSMYRAPGTSSSPDLATLLRKAKERGGATVPMVGALGRKDKRREEAPPLPDLPGDSNAVSPGRNAGTFKVRLLLIVRLEFFHRRLKKLNRPNPLLERKRARFLGK